MDCGASAKSTRTALESGISNDELKNVLSEIAGQTSVEGTGRVTALYGSDLNEDMTARDMVEAMLNQGDESARR